MGAAMNNAIFTDWSIETAWPFAPWLTLLFAVAAVALVVWVYWREDSRAGRRYRMTLAAVRLMAVGVLAIMISQATLMLQRTGSPSVAVLIDDSLSMTVADHYADKPRQSAVERLQTKQGEQAAKNGGEPSRWSLLHSLLADRDGALLHGLAKDHKLRTYFTTDMRPAGRNDVSDVIEVLRATTPKGENTRLGAGIRAVLDELRGVAPAAIVLFTDGVNTDGPTLADAAEVARRRGVPLYFVGFGDELSPRAIKLSDLLVDDVVFVDDVVNVECKLTAVGFEGQRLSVILREKNKPAAPENILAKTEATAGPDGQPRPVRLQYRPTQIGQFEYVVEVEPQKGQHWMESNRLSRVVQVRKEKIRVLLVQAYPNFEFRYLRNMLQRDATISLHTVLQDADPEHAEQDASALKTFPQSRRELFAYDVVILGDVNPALLGAAALQNLADFVDQPANGGALAMIAGPSFMPAAYRNTPLARLMPFAVKEVRYPGENLADGFVVRPTELGLADPAMQLGDTPEETARIWKNLPPVYWLLDVPELKPGVRVLADTPSRLGANGRRLPVFLLEYVGAGKVLFHATDETWRWRYRVGDVFFARYWGQTIRYLCRAKLTAAGRAAVLAADRREYVQGGPVRLRARFADERLAPAEDDGVTVMVEQAGRQTQHAVLHRAAAGRGVFEGQLERLGIGNYHAWIMNPTLEGPSSSADFVVTPPPGEFAQTRMDAAEMRRAAEATGGRFYTFAAAGDLLKDLPPCRQVLIESLPSLPLWNRWPVLAAFLGLLVAEWILRKRCGMV
jgi:hypothetical protein